MWNGFFAKGLISPAELMKQEVGSECWYECSDVVKFRTSLSAYSVRADTKKLASMKFVSVGTNDTVVFLVKCTVVEK